MYTLAAFTAILASVLAAPTSLSVRTVSKGTYVSYNGDGSAANGWPETSKWVSSFDQMWSDNESLIAAGCGGFSAKPNSDDDTKNLKQAIQDVSKSSGVDARVILAIVMQESKGCVRVFTTNYGVRNPGLMQDHDGQHNCNTGEGAEGKLTKPGSPADGLAVCPMDQITGMIKDGTEGTAAGDGLKQLGGTSKTAEDIYKMARKYNAGSIPQGGDLGAQGATASYCSDVANRLTGVVFDQGTWTHGNPGSGPAAGPPPTGGSTGGSTTTPPPTGGAAPSGACKTTVAVKGGDTCWALAQAAGITVASLQALNPSVSCTALQVGASVCVAK